MIKKELPFKDKSSANKVEKNQNELTNKSTLLNKKVIANKTITIPSKEKKSAVNKEANSHLKTTIKSAKKITVIKDADTTLLKDDKLKLIESYYQMLVSHNLYPLPTEIKTVNDVIIKLYKNQVDKKVFSNIVNFVKFSDPAYTEAVKKISQEIQWETLHNVVRQLTMLKKPWKMNPQFSFGFTAVETQLFNMIIK